MSGRDGRPPQRRRDPRDGREYTFAEFIEYYGDAQGRQIWQRARNDNHGGSPAGGARGPRTRYYVGQKVVALTKLRGNNGIVVRKGTIGEVTAVPGLDNVKIDQNAVAEVLISGIRFDAQPDMIEPHQAGYAAKSHGSNGYDRPQSGGRQERRVDPSDPRGTTRYTREEFLQYYSPGKGAALWEAAGRAEEKPERRADPSEPNSKKKYTRREFIAEYGEKKGNALWKQAASTSTTQEKRADPEDPASKKTYTRKEFLEFHGPQKGTALWNEAGKNARGAAGAKSERRRDPTEKDSNNKYTKQEFIDLYGKKKGESLWEKASASAADEKRADPNEPGSKKKYTKKEFVEFYGAKEADKLWRKSAEPKKKVEDVRIKIEITRGEGNVIGWTREDLRVLLVETDGPAAKAGVKPGYKVVAIAGKPAKKSTIASLLKGVETPEVEVEFVETRKDDGQWFTQSQFVEYYGHREGLSRWKRAERGVAREKKERPERKKKTTNFVIQGMTADKKVIFA